MSRLSSGQARVNKEFTNKQYVKHMDPHGICLRKDWKMSVRI